MVTTADPLPRCVKSVVIINCHDKRKYEYKAKQQTNEGKKADRLEIQTEKSHTDIPIRN